MEKRDNDRKHSKTQKEQQLKEQNEKRLHKERLDVLKAVQFYKIDALQKFALRLLLNKNKLLASRDEVIR